jgi:hypothetical protein
MPPIVVCCQFCAKRVWWVTEKRAGWHLSVCPSAQRDLFGHDANECGAAAAGPCMAHLAAGRQRCDLCADFPGLGLFPMHDGDYDTKLVNVGPDGKQDNAGRSPA